MAPTSRASHGNKPDFKRIKAKVGKRAPKPANETNTSFRAASLTVRSQVVAAPPSENHEVIPNKVLVSTRGKSVPELLSHLHHPAAPVRMSAAKGLLDILLQQNHPPTSDHHRPSSTHRATLLQKTHASLWLPAIGKCNVDEEPSIRQVGMSLLQAWIDPLLQLDHHHLAATAVGSPTRLTATCLPPFAPLLLAFTKSALHSLDRSTRHHGAAMMALLCRSIPGLFTSAPPTCTMPISLELLSSSSTANNNNNKSSLDASSSLEPMPPQQVITDFFPAWARLLQDRSAVEVTVLDVPSASSSALASSSSSWEPSQTAKNHPSASSSTHQTKNRKKRQARASKALQDGPLQQILEALIALLWQVKPLTSITADTVNMSLSISIEKGGEHRGLHAHPPSLVVPGWGPPRRPRTLPTMTSLNHLAVWCRGHAIDDAWNVSGNDLASDPFTPPQLLIMVKNILDLVSKLRDVLLEVTQRGRHSFEQQGFYLDTAFDVDLFLAVVRSLRLLWERYPATLNRAVPNKSPTRRVNDQEQFKVHVNLQKACSQITTLMVESFPLQTQHPGRRQETQDANAEMCVWLMLMVRSATESPPATSKTSAETDREHSSWMRRVASFVESSLEEGKTQWMTSLDSTHRRSSSSSSSPDLWAILTRLMVDSRPDQTNVRMGLVERLANIFFLVEESTISTTTALTETTATPTEVSLIRSEAGRQAVLLALAMLQRCQYDLKAVRSFYGDRAVERIFHGLPRYLEKWRGDFDETSLAVIGGLQQVVRRIDRPDHPTLYRLRGQLEIMVKGVVEDPSNTSTADKASSLLATYNPELQRQVICLIYLLQSPTLTMVKGLGRVCAQSRRGLSQPALHHSICSFIVQGLHRIRKTVPMQAYLGFLMDSTAMVDLGQHPLHYKSWSDLGRILHALDKGVADAACCLVECGILKVLPMIQPLLSVMLRGAGERRDHEEENDESSNKKDINSSPIKTGADLIRSRAALSIMAGMAWHLRKLEPDLSIFSVLPPGFEKSVVAAATRILGGYGLPSSLDDPHHENDPAKEETLLRWIRPVFVLMEATTLEGRHALDHDELKDQSLLPAVWISLVNMLDEEKRSMDAGRQTLIFQVLLDHLLSPGCPLLGTVRRHGLLLKDQWLGLVTRLDDGPPRILAEQLLGQLELACA